MKDSFAFETLAIHAGQEADPSTGAVMPPVYLTSTYKQDSVGKTRGTSILAPGTRRATLLKRVWPPSKGGAAAWPSHQAWPPQMPCSTS